MRVEKYQIVGNYRLNVGHGVLPFPYATERGISD
jgi:hypothetical protein